MDLSSTRYLTQFIGRQRELAEIRRLLIERHMLTLTGPGGSGKTRLAVEALAGLAGEFAGGRYVIELAEINAPELILQRLASAIGVREVPGHSLLETVMGFLQGRRTLVMLDNCEHVLAACARLAGELLANCPHLHLLVTSRQALGLAGEMVRPMLPLDLPSTTHDLAALSQVEAVALFIDRAAMRVHGFSLTVDNAPGIVRICRCLDGLPLAIELAAA